MKAERRHELQTNSLALWLRWRAPEIWQQYGSRILLGVIIVALAIVLLRSRIQAPKLAAEQAAADLNLARNAINEIRAGVRPAHETPEITRLINSALANSTVPDIQAKAHLDLGDYYWELATAPVPPEATTQPSLKPDRSPDEFLAEAHDAYEKALKDQTRQPDLIARAHIGLGAIAETQAGQLEEASAATRPSTSQPSADTYWATAEENYNAIINAPDMLPLLQDEARWHLAQLPQMRKSVWIQAATQPASDRFIELGSVTTPPATQPAPQGPPVPEQLAPATQPKK